MQHQICRVGLASERTARNKILRIVLKREKELAEKAPAPTAETSFRTDVDPDNANAALKILGKA